MYTLGNEWSVGYVFRVRNGIERAIAQDANLAVEDGNGKISLGRKELWRVARDCLDSMRARISTFIVRYRIYSLDLMAHRHRDIILTRISRRN